LLCAEAESAGIDVSPDETSKALQQIVPQLFPGQTYAVVMSSLVNRLQVSEQDVVEAVGKLLAVLQYAQIVCSMEDVTIPQLAHIARRDGESLDAELVKFDCHAFADGQSPPAEEAVRVHFDRYKNDVAGHVSADNPFGFGYRLPDGLQLEYVALKRDDLARTVAAPTQEEAGLYYQQNRERLFTERVPSDPDDPNSPSISRVKGYAEVAGVIAEQLKQQTVTAKAERILNEVRVRADADLPADAGQGTASSMEQLKDRAGDYGQIAGQLSSKFGVPLYSGRTGWLGAADLLTDEGFRGLYLSDSGAGPVALGRALFSVDAFGGEAAPAVPTPRVAMYATIGPAGDPLRASPVMLVTRIVGVRRAGAPESLDATFSTRALDLGERASQKNPDYSVRDKVAEDLRALAAWDTTRKRAEEFLATASRQGWDAAVAEFNGLYSKRAGQDHAGEFTIERLTALQRISNAQLRTVAAQSESSPAASTMLDRAQVEKQFADRLYSLVSAEATSAPNLPSVLEFKPGRCFYAIKNVSVQRLSRQQYEDMKGVLLAREDHVQTQSLAAVHFDPANIVRRMAFRPVRQTPPVQEDSSPRAQ
jgi:hypothetical protein